MSENTVTPTDSKPPHDPSDGATATTTDVTTATTTDTTTDTDNAPLTERDLAMLQFEATWFNLDEDRHDAIRARFACSAEEYNLQLNRVIDHPAALLADQLVVRRLRRHRERRRRTLIDGAAAGEQG